MVGVDENERGTSDGRIVSTFNRKIFTTSTYKIYIKLYTNRLQNQIHFFRIERKKPIPPIQTHTHTRNTPPQQCIIYSYYYLRCVQTFNKLRYANIKAN